MQSMTFNSVSDVEAFLAINPEQLNHLDRKEAVVKLQEFLNSENNGLNSKLKRKASRFLTTLDPNKSVESNENKSALNIGPQISKLVHALSQATILREVEAAMNCFDFQTGFNELDVDDNRNTLKTQLTKTLQLSINLNKPIRRRIERLLFVASTKDEQVEIKSKPKQVNTNTIQRTRNQNQNQNQSQLQTDKSLSSFQKAAATSQLNELPTRISNAKSGIELEAHLNSLSDLSIEDSGISELQKNKLVEALEALLSESYALKDSLNAKSRRRVKRLIERVRSPPTQKSTESHDDVEVNKSVTIPARTKMALVSYPESKIPGKSGKTSTMDKSKAPTSQQTAADATLNWAARIAGLRTTEGLDTLLDTLTEASVETYSGPTKKSLSDALVAVQANRTLMKNAKQRRKTTRLIDRLTNTSAPTVFGDRTVGTWDEDTNDNKRLKI